MAAATPKLSGGLVLSVLLIGCVVPWSLQAGPWYIGCYHRSSLHFQENGYETLQAHRGDLPACSRLCLQNHFQLTLRIDEIDCRCANMSIFDGSIVSSVNATETKRRWNAVRSTCASRCTKPLCLPHGDGRGMLAIFTSGGPYISDVNMSFHNDQIEIGKTLILEISGYLAASLERITATRNLEIENLVTVAVTVRWSAQNASSSVARVGRNGRFTSSFSLFYSDPGNYSIRAHAKNMISEKECELNVEILRREPLSLGTKNIAEEPRISSCSPSDLGAVKSIMIAFWRVHHRFQAFVLRGTDPNFPWCFMDKNDNFVENQTQLSCVVTIGQIGIGLPDITSNNLTIPITLVLESGSAVYIEVLLNDKITLQNLVCLPGNTADGRFEASAIVSLEESPQSTQLYATDADDMRVASINVLHRPMLGEEIILVATINGQVSWDKDYVYTWTLANNVSHSSGSPLITCTCTKLGLHSVRLNVTNYVTTVNGYVEYNVVKQESVPRLSHPSNIQLEEPVLFLLKLPLSRLPEDERITLHFGDNTSIHVSGPYFGNDGMKISHRYKASGLYRPTLLLQRAAIELPSLLLIEQPLQRLILYGPAVHALSLVAPSRLTYIVRANTASHALYRWIFSDGETNGTMIGANKLNLHIKAPCRLTVKIEVESYRQILSASMQTVVQYPISDVTLTMQEAFAGRFTRFIVAVEPFQQYTLLTRFGEDESIQVHSQEFAQGCLHKQHFCSVFILLHKYNHAACYNVSVEVSNSVSTVRKMAEATIEEAIEIMLLTPLIIKVGDFINATLSLKSTSGVSYLWTVHSPSYNHSLLGSSLSLIANVSGMCYVTASESSRPQIRSAAEHVKVLDAIDNVTVFIATGIDHASIEENADGSYSTERLQFKALADSEAKFRFDFGDGTTSLPINGRAQTTGFGASAFHRYSKAGNYIIKVMAFNELFAATAEAGPYYVQAAPAGLSIVTDSNSVYKDDIILFSAALTGGTNVSYLWSAGDDTTCSNIGPQINVTFSSVANYNVTVTAWNKVGMQKAWKVISVRPRKKSIYIYTNGTVFSTDAYITFTAVTEEPGPMVFSWQFDDRSPERTVRRSLIKRLTVPNRYNITVNASNQRTSVTSDPYTVFVQRKVVPNRLVASSAVLINSSVSFNCRINSGTNASYFWNFGDGVERLGQNNDTHVFTREGEYAVRVSVFNNVSSAFLSKQVFAVKEHCQPPPVKNMGPPKIQIKRYEELRLGVTFEAAGILCNISQGLSYLWSFVRSDGSVVALPPNIDNKKQTITLPAFFLGYGNYTAVARVQIVGNVVYSNYSVPVEVQPSDPVSAIANGHHFFIDKATVKYFTLNGTPSFDPDNPGAQLRFRWSCAPLAAHEHSCFDSNALNPLKDDPVVSFPTAQLNERGHQFHFTLTVSNGERKSSNAETFLSVSHHTKLRSVEVTCAACRGLFVNWDQPLSVQAVCADCSSAHHISYLWNLYWINATETSTADVPFCRLKESMGAPRALGENNPDGTSSKGPTLPITSHHVYPTVRYAEKQVTEHFPQAADLPKLVSDHAESSRSVPDLYMMEFSESHLDLLDEGSTGGREIPRRQSAGDADPDYQGLHAYDMSGFISGEGENLVSNATKGQTHNDFDTHFYGNIVEGIGGSGTRTGSDLDFSYDFSDDFAAPHAGDNFVDLSVAAPNVLPMVHWLKLPISNDLFQSYTVSGVSSQTVTMRPFLLTPTKMYMLDVNLESNGYKIGRSQLYFTVNEMSHKITCQVQPRSGTELFTAFSIFCTSGKEDLNYEFSYQVGELSRKTLYKGRDIQYYFNLPSGDPSRGYQVTVFTQITNIYGSQTRPCPVNVTVLPMVFHNMSGNPLPQLELFQESLRNLSTLVLMGSHNEIRNYIVLLTTVVNRLNTEDSGMSFELQSEIRNKFIFIVRGLSFSNQDDLNDIMSMLRDLFNATNQVTADSAMLIINYTQSVVKETFVDAETGRYEVQKKLVDNVIWLLSGAIEVHSRWPEQKAMFEKGVKCMSDVMLKFITFSNERHFAISTNFLELQISVHPNVQNNIGRISSTTFYLPEILDSQNRRENTSMKCYISQLKAFKKNPYFWAKLPSEVNGDFTSLSLFDCSARKKIGAQDILSPVTMEIDNKNQIENFKNFNKTQYILFRDKINFHQFNMIGKNKQSALQITVRFVRPKTRTFPVLLLIRHSKKPSPSSFNIQLIHSLEEPSAQIFLPADSLRDAEYSYMALMDADYRRHPKNKYTSNMVNYTLDVRWIQCLYWSNKHWQSEDCSPQKGATATVFTCSCTHVGMFTSASRQVSSHFHTEDISPFLSPTKNLIPPIVVVICALIYVLLMFSGKIKDQHEDPKDGLVFLQDNSPNDQQQYAIMVDVGFRSRPKTTAKVYIVLHGQDGVSETRELFRPEKPLFERNCRHTFIMSLPESLGPLWKIHIWHNNTGSSPSMYLSHVVVKDLRSGASWLFYAECWLALDEGDGKVEREVTSVGHGLGFRRLFYCKFTEYLEDFHLWGSVFSRPSYSWFSRTQRITACFVLLLGYMCLNALLIHWEEEQYTVEIGLTEVSPVSMRCGLKVTAAVYPAVVLLSLLFRCSQKQFAKDSGANRMKTAKGSPMDNPEGRQHSASAAGTVVESSLTWQHLQYWAYDAWKTKYERDFSTSSVDLQNDRRRSKNPWPSVSTQGSSGFEDCSSNDGGKTGLEEFTDCGNSSCSQYSSDRSLSRSSAFHGNKVLPAWCVYVAWTVSAATILVCVTVIVAFGFRFGATKCVLWLHALFFSLISCIFVLQPSLIVLIALFVAWRKRQKTDFFWEALSDDVKYIVGESCRACSRQRSNDKSNFEKILAARRRARYLRLARPPTPAQLKTAKDKLRRKTIIGKMFRELAVCMIMASMVITIIAGKYSHNEYYVNRAVRNEFTRNAKQPFTEIRTMDHWWNFGFNVLLDGLYWNKGHNEDSLKEVGPIEGKFYTVGDPLMRKLDIANDSSCTMSPFSTPALPACTLSHLPNGAKDTNCTMKIQDCTFYQCGKIQCYKDSGPGISLGRSRTEAYAALWETRNQEWIDRRTSAFLVHFLLYNPPTNLFTTVSLLTEFAASGDIITSSRIDSISIYRATTIMDYGIMVIELMYLGMVFICFYLQLNILIQRGIRSYWQEPWNWVEASIVALSLCGFSGQVYHFMLTVDAADQLQRRFMKVFIHFSLIAGVEKWTRCLHRILLFLLIIRFIRLLRFYRLTAPWAAVLQLACARSASTMHIGVVFIMAFSSSGYLIFSTESYSFCSALNSILTISTHLLGLRGIKHIQFLQNQIKSNHMAVSCFYGALFIAFAIVWTGMSHYLDEFEDLVDELLFRLNAISNSLHHSLPAKSQSYTEEDGDVQNSDGRAALSCKQTMTETEECSPRGELRRDPFTPQAEPPRAHCDVLGIHLSCLPQGSRNRYSIPEEVLSKLNYSEVAINHEDECGLPVGNRKQCLEAPQYLPRDEKAILPPVLYLQPFASAINLQYDKTDCKTRCTSANIQSQTCRALRRSHATVLQPTALWKNSNVRGRKATANLSDEGGTEQPQCNGFQQSFHGVLNERESTETHVETATRRFQQKPISTAIQSDDKTPPNTNASGTPCSVKQCW